MPLTKPLQSLTGVGPSLAEKLAACGIHSIQDLLFHLPYRYQDRTRITPIQDLRHNDWAVVMGRICKTELSYGKRRTLNCWIEDKTGLLRLRFFHFNTHQARQLEANKLIRAFGEVRQFDHQAGMIHPEYQILEEHSDCSVEETLTPIYPSTQGLSQNRLRQIIADALNAYQSELEGLEWMKPEELENYRLSSLAFALFSLHHPSPDHRIEFLESGNHPGLKRLAFEELLAQQLSMAFARQQRASLQAPMMPPQNTLTPALIAQLPFQLTKAQARVFDDIAKDLAQSKPMLRLVQGDVGSGKTVVAALAALQGIENGYQVALMAPTDILSEQHAEAMTRWCQPLGISVQRLSGKMKAKERKVALANIAEHQSQLIVGTHALFQDQVLFARLGLVIIDEQHRFGVAQRLQLQQKGQNLGQPHQLLMTATPIPRTLAMTQFAHLDLSIIDELPPGRTPITTVVMHQDKRGLIVQRLRQAIEEGRQAYWVCTLIEESESLQCQAATDSADYLQSELPGCRIGLIHGRLSAQLKDQIMQQFKRGELQILVATTVIEVGVDVPNASLMIIENAERLGLSQLHQLRGRVGRGSIQSHCILLYHTPLSAMSRERLQLMRETQDGFVIAEKDLKLRGAGDILGTRQTGYQHFKIADLSRDQHLLQWLKPMAERLLKEEPSLAHLIAKRWLGAFEHLIVT